MRQGKLKQHLRNIGVQAMCCTPTVRDNQTGEMRPAPELANAIAYTVAYIEGLIEGRYTPREPHEVISLCLQQAVSAAQDGGTPNAATDSKKAE